MYLGIDLKYKGVPNSAWDKFQVCFIVLAVWKPKEEIRKKLIIIITLRDNDNIKGISKFIHFRGPHKVQESLTQFIIRNFFKRTKVLLWSWSNLFPLYTQRKNWLLISERRNKSFLHRLGALETWESNIYYNFTDD